VCGICGIVDLGPPSAPADARVLEAMLAAIAHRGPDDQGLHIDAGIALGARRLSIIDVEGGHQPFANEDGTVWAAQNGELYNHVALRRELEGDGHRLRSRCDTEILPHLYERDGDRFCEALRGMFSIAVWDARRRRAVIARDRLGKKPLFWARRGSAVVFASELKSLLASGLIDPQLDVEAIDVYLALGFFPGTRTPLAGVQKLLPGHRLVVDADGVRSERYWSYPEPAAAPVARSEEWYAERTLALLDESVRMRMMSDVPLGAMLSGGLDSSLIVALMARASAQPVKTFSVGFTGPGADSELADARLVADRFGCEHHELELELDERVDLAALVWHLDEPLADLSSLGFLALSGLARQHVTVALSGQGADELYAGYNKHRAASVAERYQRWTGPFAQPVARLAGRLPGRPGHIGRSLAAMNGADRLIVSSANVDGALRARLARGALAELDGGAALREARAALGGLVAPPLATLLYLDGQLGLVEDMLLYFDRASMAHSLEVRVPFLDHELVEFAATVPTALKVKGLETKHVLKRAARGLVPDAIIDKPKKGFFRSSVDAWLGRQLEGAAADYLLAPDPAYGALLDPAEVGRLVRAHVDGHDRSHGHALLGILMLEVWLTTFLPRAREACPPELRRIGSIRS
jgi:asparagine synthase (glutamine-hydrolysing)